MSPFADPANDDDLHDLMAVAVLCGQRGVEADVFAIYEAWGAAYPQDALGGVGRGLRLIAQGDPREGFRVIDETARTATTRTEQARDVLAALRRDVAALAE